MNGKEPNVKFSKSQTLITGVYRSGTEYVTQLINSHPCISATMYRVNVLRFIAGRYDPISDRKMQINALEDIAQRINDRYHCKIDKQKILRCFESSKNLDYWKFYDIVMSAMYLDPGCDHWAEKNQLLWREIPDFIERMPNGKAILIIRDPRSVLASFKRYTYAPPPAYIGAVFNCFDAMRAGKELSEIFPSEKFIKLCYEDVVRDPYRWIKHIWAMLGLSIDQEISWEGWEDAYGRSWHANSSFHDNHDMRAFDLESSINRWKTQLSEPEISLTEAVCGDLMLSYGYSLSGIEPNWPNMLKLFVQDNKLLEYFRCWLIKGRGIQAFPNNPLEPENWEK